MSDPVLRIAYLVNRYPAVSHTFIRREIQAVEAAGAEVWRYSVRDPGANLPDPRDQAELDRISILLKDNVGEFAAAILKRAVSNPPDFIRSLGLALKIAGPSPRGIFRHLAYLGEACVMFYRLLKQPVDHVHAHFGTNPAMVARLLHRLGGPPYSFTVHGPDEFDRPLELDLSGKIAEANLVVAISSFGRSQLMRWSDPGHWPRIGIARCGVDGSYLSAADEDNFPDLPHLCCIARLSGQKGLPLLVEAAALLNERKIDFHLTLVGDGEMRDEIDALIAKHALGSKITITGWAGSEAVRDHILSSRAMVLPSFAEGLPVVIMEALALGRPVIATAIAGIPELVDEGCGWLIPAGSVERCADAMAEALASPTDTLKRLGEEGRTRVAERHDAGVNGAGLLQLIRRSHVQSAA